ncbi:unnamed protein product [Hymenolepis diminuta]|uniref:Uncharacterized protein n=1 Tax=Hymenolepis diminuta TaxID=6216 RepID=A0A0R3SAD4_HYMDI|nr:unnamed protein product [Hymenolepis diminuta]
MIDWADVIMEYYEQVKSSRQDEEQSTRFKLIIRLVYEAVSLPVLRQSTYSLLGHRSRVSDICLHWRLLVGLPSIDRCQTLRLVIPNVGCQWQSGVFLTAIPIGEEVSRISQIA